MKRDLTGWMRGTAVVLMSLVTVFNILGGVGGICVAFGDAKYKPAVPYLDYQHIYQPTTLIILAVGLIAVIATYALLRGERWAWWGSVILIVISAIATYTKMHYSLIIRNSAAPGNVRFVIDLVALAFLLIMMIPAIKRKIDWTRSLGDFGGYSRSGGVAMMVTGLITATSPLWAGASHTIDGVNYAAEIWGITLGLGGGMFVIGGLILTALYLGVDIDGWVRSLFSRGTPKPADSKAEGGR